MKRAIILKKPSGTIAIGGNMDIRERKFYNGFLKVAKETVAEDPRSHIFTVPLLELKKVLNVQEMDKNNAVLKKIIKRMHKIDIEYNVFSKDKSIEGYASLLDNVEFIMDNKSGSTIVQYSIPEKVRLAMLKNNGIYATINLVIIKGLRSKYSVLLYELIKDYKNVEIPEMSIDKFRKLFGLDTGEKDKNGNEIKKYLKMPDVRKWVLDAACNELNSNSNIDFEISYQLKKTGKAYTSIKFIFKQTTASIKKQQKVAGQLDDKVIKNKDLQQLIELLPVKLQAKTKIISIVYASLEKNGKDYTRAQVEYFNAEYEKGKIQKPTSYLSATIKNDYATAKISKAVIGIKAEQAEAKKTEHRTKEKEEEEKRQQVEEEERQITDYYRNLSEDAQNQIKNEALIRLHEKFPDAPANSHTFGTLSIKIATNKIIREILEKAHE